jgi:hypothetical protein
LRDFQALYDLAFGALYAAGGIAIILCSTAWPTCLERSGQRSYGVARSAGSPLSSYSSLTPDLAPAGTGILVSTLQEFKTAVLLTKERPLFLATGNVVGALLSMIAFSLTVLSFPLLLEHEVDLVAAW